MVSAFGKTAQAASTFAKAAYSQRLLQHPHVLPCGESSHVQRSVDTEFFTARIPKSHSHTL